MSTASTVTIPKTYRPSVRRLFVKGPGVQGSVSWDTKIPCRPVSIFRSKSAAKVALREIRHQQRRNRTTYDHFEVIPTPAGRWLVVRFFAPTSADEYRATYALAVSGLEGGRKRTVL